MFLETIPARLHVGSISIIHLSENKGATTMAVPKCMLKGKELDDVREDFRTARRVEQYRLGEIFISKKF